MHVGLGVVLFDVDGVLLDSLPAYRRAWGSWAREAGIAEAAIWAVAHGRRPVDIVRAVAGGGLDEAWWLRRFRRLIADEYLHVPAMPGAQRLLARLPDRRWAVVTSGDRDLVVEAFTRLGMPVPTVGVYGDEVTAGKPDPSGYLLAGRRLDAEPGNCLVVEDAPSGIAAARAAGMPVLAVTTTHTADQLGGAVALYPDLAATAAALSHWTTTNQHCAADRGSVPQIRA